MEFVNVLDERNRFIKVTGYIHHKQHQVNSHTTSYLAARKTYEQIGYTMGLNTDNALYTLLEHEEE